MLCLVICAVKGEGEADAPAFIAELVERHGVAAWLTPEERAFLAERACPLQRRAQLTWRYEGVHVLQWWLGMVDDLQPPHAICDVPATVRLVHGRTVDQVVAAARPRPVAELLDQADLHYRLHWAAISLRLRGAGSPALHEGIVRKRHHALNWLIRYRGADWDEVPTDT